MPVEKKLPDTNFHSKNSTDIDDLEKEIADLEEAQRKAAEGIVDEEEDKEEAPKDLKETKVKEKEPKDKLEDVKEEEDLSAEEKTFKQRYGDSRRFIQKLQDELKAAKEVKEKTLNAPTSDEDLEKWSTENPEIASIVETIAAKKANERYQDSEKQLKDIDEERFELKREKAENSIRKKHEDYDDIKADDAFHTWASEQPKIIQDALYEDQEDWRSVARVIDMYKSDKGLTKEAQKEEIRQAAMATDVKGGTKPENKKKMAWSESKVERLSTDEYLKHEEAIDEAITSGNFVYDLTGR